MKKHCRNNYLDGLAKSIFLYAFVLICLSGCAVVGTSVPDGKRITLAENKTTHGSFKDGALTVNYNYTRSSHEIKVTGVANYTDRMDSLDIRMLALDTNGTIVQQSLIFSSGYRQGSVKRSEIQFNTTVDVPQDVTGMSFVASGQPRRGHR